MCGRFTQTKSCEEVLEALGEIELPPLFCGRYNIAPTQRVAVLRQKTPTRAEECIWGFKNPRSGAPIINARAETLNVRPMFKNLLSDSRCLVPADGFYEWKGKQPYYFQLPDRRLFAFAGLWHNGRCTIITRAANRTMQGIHDRMPVILTSEHWKSWLALSCRVTSVLTIVSTDVTPSLNVIPVSRRVNKVANDDPDCLVPAVVQTDLSLFPDED